MEYSHNSNTCNFLINATAIDITDLWSRHKGRSGYLNNPKHTIPPNTTCTYQLTGQPHDIVWVYFTSYSHEPLLPAGLLAADTVNETSCLVRLKISDGNKRKSKLLENCCNDDFPRLCDHTSLANATRVTRPCSRTESYISNTNKLTIEHFSEEGKLGKKPFFLQNKEQGAIVIQKHLPSIRQYVRFCTKNISALYKKIFIIKTTVNHNFRNNYF